MKCEGDVQNKTVDWSWLSGLERGGNDVFWAQRLSRHYTDTMSLTVNKCSDTQYHATFMV